MFVHWPNPPPPGVAQPFVTPAGQHGTYAELTRGTNPGTNQGLGYHCDSSIDTSV